MTLIVKNLFFSYGKRKILNQINFSVQPGELLKIKGMNGSGKTTLLCILAELLQASSGTIEYSNKATSKLRFAYLPADSNGLFCKLNALDNLRFWLALSSDPNLQAINPSTLLDEWGLSHPYLKGSLSVAKFSTGMKRRLGLMRICSSRASCWILDEPFLGLDERGRAIFSENLKTHIDKGGMAVLTGHEEYTLSGVKTQHFFL